MGAEELGGGAAGGLVVVAGGGDVGEAVDGDDAGFGQVGLGTPNGDVAEEIEERGDVGLAGPEGQLDDGDARELLEAVERDLGVHPRGEEGGVARGEIGDGVRVHARKLRVGRAFSRRRGGMWAILRAPACDGSGRVRPRGRKAGCGETGRGAWRREGGWSGRGPALA
ncbi:MAG: hypothetical protein FJ255_11525 [Phycisphaerae bacterium]|nr:hypothetical protein [Phycisphaerae bacterium]